VRDCRTVYGDQKVDLLAWIETNKDDLVLKRADACDGVGTTVGRDVSDTVWRQALSSATLSDDLWVVQEWIDADPVELAFATSDDVVLRSCTVDYGGFVLAEDFGGAIRRNTTARAPRLTHVSSGGGLSTAFRLPVP
jgi:uncharacterized circularly permuted ATP-grasp superfamily protein